MKLINFYYKEVHVGLLYADVYLYTYQRGLAGGDACLGSSPASLYLRGAFILRRAPVL